MSSALCPMRHAFFLLFRSPFTVHRLPLVIYPTLFTAYRSPFTALYKIRDMNLGASPQLEYWNIGVLEYWGLASFLLSLQPESIIVEMVYWENHNDKA